MNAQQETDLQVAESTHSPLIQCLPNWLGVEVAARGDPDVLREIVDADRILFSNDYSYEDYARGGEFIDTVPIGESDRRKIAYENAKALYKL